MTKVISTSQAPAAIGPYSQAIIANGFLFCSGQLGINPATGEFPVGGVEAQAQQSLQNIKAILTEAGTDLSKVVKTTVFLADIKDFAVVNKIYAEAFIAPFPARSAVQVAALPKGALVEIEVIVAL